MTSNGTVAVNESTLHVDVDYWPNSVSLVRMVWAPLAAYIHWITSRITAFSNMKQNSCPYDDSTKAQPLLLCQCYYCRLINQVALHVMMSSHRLGRNCCVAYEDTGGGCCTGYDPGGGGGIGSINPALSDKHLLNNNCLIQLLNMALVSHPIYQSIEYDNMNM